MTPIDDLNEGCDLDRAKEVLLTAFAEQASREGLRRIEKEINACADLPELVLTASTLVMQEVLETDVVAILREAGAWESETEGVLVETGPMASDAPVEEATEERTKRMAILVPYGDLISPQRREQLLSTHFMEDDSLALNIYRGVVWTLTEPAIDGILGDLVQAEAERIPGKPVSKNKTKELKKQAEASAMERAKDRLRSLGIEEPAA